MTDAPKRIWVVDEKPAGDICWRDNIFFTDNKASGCGAGPLPLVEYHCADLSADLVRAGVLAGLESAAAPIYKWSIAAAEEIEALSADPETIAAIVARVTEGLGE